jgi:hypothetical protein
LQNTAESVALFLPAKTDVLRSITDTAVFQLFGGAEEANKDEGLFVVSSYQP